jgi:hypothetical protein
MRTTLSLDDDLLRAAKRRAAELGTTVSEVVSRALRRGFADAEGTHLRDGGTITYGGAPGTGLSDVELRAWQQRLDDDVAAAQAEPRRTRRS